MNTVWKVIRGVLIAFGLMALCCILTVSCSVTTLDQVFDGELGGNAMLDEPIVYEFSGDIYGLDIDLAAADLTIRQGEGFSVETNGKYIRCEKSGEVLVLAEQEHFGLFRNDCPMVILTIPEGYWFRQIKLETAACRVVADELRGETMELELGAGEFIIDQLYVTKSAGIQGGAGKLVIRQGELHDLELEMGVGELKLCAHLLGDTDMEMGTGSAEIDLVGTQADYQIRVDTGIGSVRLEQQKVEDGVLYGSGENQIRIEGGIGEVEIRFIDKE